MPDSETINSMALAMMFPNRPKQLLELVRRAGSATAIVQNHDRLREIVPELNPNVFLIDGSRLAECIQRARAEAEFAAANGIRVLTVGSPDYPARLREVCPDAPIVLYFRGDANLNSVHILSIVGTRSSTQYGLDMVNSICGELAAYFPDLLIVSGLAYGTDINAHRVAMEHNLPTVAVLAHGLDRIYPTMHRNTASRMTANGGLLTEYPSATNPDPQNFLRRNRIIAAIAEGTLVVESKERGGALTTARLANDYSLAVMACPGRATDPSSVGCNNLISSNSAALVSSAADVIKVLGWQVPKKRHSPTLPSMFEPTFTAEEKIIYDLLSDEPKHISALTVSTLMPVNKVLSILCELEFRGIARQLPGSNWRRC